MRNSSPPPFLLDTISFTSDALAERGIDPDDLGGIAISADPISALSIPDLSDSRNLISPSQEELFKQEQFLIPPLSLSEPLVASDAQTNSSESILFRVQQSSHKDHALTDGAHDSNWASLDGTSQLKAQPMECVPDPSKNCVPSNVIALSSEVDSLEKIVGCRRTDSSKPRNNVHTSSNSGSVSGKKKRNKGAGTSSGLLASSSQSAITLKEQRARRNRESAKRSRIKNKLYFEKLEATYFEVCNENKSLKQMIEQLLPSILDISPELRTQLEALFDANPSIKLI